MNKNIASIAKTLRKQSTHAEKFLWKHIREKQLEGFKFRRQEPIGKYIVDFVCFQKQVVIEIDGGQHAGNVTDRERDNWLRRQGYKVLRFWNNEVLTNIEGVLEMIRINCLNHPPFLPSRQGRENSVTKL